MCHGGTSKIQLLPQIELADLMKEELGVTIDPRLLKLFIRFKWRDLTRLAHAIHDSDTPSPN